MSVTARIKQKSLFKRKLSRDDVIDLMGLSYGVSDENFVLIRGEKADHTLLYDETKLARGIELWVENNDILLSLSLPTSRLEIRLFYKMIETICHQLKTNKYLREDVSANISDSLQYIKWDEETSIMALKDIEEKIGDDTQRFEMFGIFNPITLGKKEMNRINHNLDCLEVFLDEIQSLDVYYASPRVYRKKETDQLLGVYAIVENIPCVIPLKPYIVLDQIKGVEQWYVMVRKGKTIKYDDFINHVEVKQYYDSNHIIVSCNENEIDELINKYIIEI